MDPGGYYYKEENMSLETGEKYLFRIPEFGFETELPWVEIRSDDKRMRIASLNMVGMIEWNTILDIFF